MGVWIESWSARASSPRIGRPPATQHRSPLPPTHVAALACPHNPTHRSPHSTQYHTHSAQALVPHAHSLPGLRIEASSFSRTCVSPLFSLGKRGRVRINAQAHPSSISASSDRMSSIASFSLRTASFSSSWLAVALTEMSANLLGNSIEVSSQDRAE